MIHSKCAILIPLIILAYLDSSIFFLGFGMFSIIVLVMMPLANLVFLKSGSYGLIISVHICRCMFSDMVLFSCFSLYIVNFSLVFSINLSMILGHVFCVSLHVSRCSGVSMAVLQRWQLSVFVVLILCRKSMVGSCLFRSMVRKEWVRKLV